MWIEPSKLATVTRNAMLPPFPGKQVRAIYQMAEIAIDLHWMRIGKVGGVEQATYELVRGLSRFDRANRYRLESPRSTYFDWSFPDTFQHSVFFTDRIEWERRQWRRRFWGSEFPCDESPEPADLLHAPSGYLPRSFRAKRLIVTIHDLQHLTFPEYFNDAEIAYRDEQLKRIVETANHFICISDFTAKDLMRHFSVPAESITTIWNIPDPKFTKEIRMLDQDRLLKKLGIRKRFFLYPSYPWAHKNHSRLLQVWETLGKTGIAKSWQLVLTGRPFPETHPMYDALMRLVGAGRTVHVGYRTPEEMRILFHAADFLFFPSEYEGFGLPVAEAFLAGLPVGASRTGSLPEIAGEAALFFDPFSVESMEDALRDLIENQDLREELRDRGRVRAALFHPRILVEKTLQAYHKALAGSATAVASSENSAPLWLDDSAMSRDPFERFRHHARNSEKAARENSWFRAGAFTGAAFATSPAMACRRLGGTAACHSEVTLYQWLERWRRKQRSKSAIRFRGL